MTIGAVQVDMTEMLNMLQSLADYLIDAMIMFEQIEKNKQMPPFAQTTNQYIAKGKEIRKFLIDNRLMVEVQNAKTS